MQEYVYEYNDLGHRIRIFNYGEGWFWQTACDSFDIGSEPCGPYDTARDAYEEARDSVDEDDVLPEWSDQ